jgi:hypothetical protein
LAKRHIAMTRQNGAVLLTLTGPRHADLACGSGNYRIGVGCEPQIGRAGSAASQFTQWLAGMR